MNPARTITLRLQVHLPEGCNFTGEGGYGESEAATLARWMTEHIRNFYLPQITRGPMPTVLAMPVVHMPARREGGAE